jgi:hypothetical protein
MYTGPLIDTDIHHQPKKDADLLPYVPLRSRELVERMIEHRAFLGGLRAIPTVAGGLLRHDAYPPDGPPGSSYELLAEQYLDPAGMTRCLLTFNVGEYGSHLNPYVSADLCTAANDWNVENWLDRDDRLYSGIVVSGQLPDEARKEVLRLADHPRMSCVIIGGSPLARGLGDPLYHPIYEAAAEVGLPIVCHLGVSVLQSGKAIVGNASTFAEVNLSLATAGGQNVTSFIVHGVFEKYPQLRVVMNEYGVSWLPPLLWSLDREYPLLRLESPWVKKPPSEYVREHIRLATQPLETTSDGRELIQFLSTVDGIEDLLCFSSDYPHLTMDDFAFVSKVLPDSWHDKVFFENARDVFGWHDLSGATRRVLSGATA